MKRSLAERGGVLLALPGAFGPAGGLEMYDRLVIMAAAAACRESSLRCDVLILNDKPSDLDSRYLDDVSSIESFSKSKWRFSAAVLRSVLARRPRLVIFGHVHLAPLAALSRIIKGDAKQWFLVYGIDFWVRLSRLTRLVVSRAEKIISISDYTRRVGGRANSIPSEKIDLLPCALDPFWEKQHREMIANATMPDDPVLLTVARLAASERYKGIEEVIRIMPQLLSKHPRLRYTIVGDGDDRTRLEAVARELNVGSAIDFRGRVSPTELAEAYASCTVFVMPSEKEGFGIVFLEAAAFRKPSIGAPFGGTTEVIQDHETGLLLSPHDRDQLIEGISSLISNPDSASALGAAAHERLVESFTFAKLDRTVRDLMESV